MKNPEKNECQHYENGFLKPEYTHDQHFEECVMKDHTPKPEGKKESSCCGAEMYDNAEWGATCTSCKRPCFPLPPAPEKPKECEGCKGNDPYGDTHTCKPPEVSPEKKEMCEPISECHKQPVVFFTNRKGVPSQFCGGVNGCGKECAYYEPTPTLTERKGEWLSVFQDFHKNDHSLGSAGWNVAPSTVEIFIRGLLAQKEQAAKAEIQERIEGMRIDTTGRDTDVRLAIDQVLSDILALLSDKKPE